MFSLRTMFIGVAYAASVLAVVVYRSSFSGSLILAFTLAIAFAATVAARLSVERRTFYGPMAGAMWLYMLILYYEPLGELERSLWTNQVIFTGWDNMQKARSKTGANWVRLHQFYHETRVRQPTLKKNTQFVIVEMTAFYQATHSASALLLGLLAGWITVWMEKRRKADESS